MRGLTKIFAAAAMAMGMGACTTTAPLPGQCMEGTSTSAPANIITTHSFIWNEKCGNAMMNKTIMQVGVETGDDIMIGVAIAAQAKQDPNLASAIDRAAYTLAHPNAQLICKAGKLIEGTTNREMECEPLVLVEKPVVAPQ